MAVTDHGAHGSRCLLLDTWGGPPRDLSAAVARSDSATGKRMRDSKEVYCDIFGRVRGTPRIALIVSGDGGTTRADFRQDLHYDVAADTVTAVR